MGKHTKNNKVPNSIYSRWEKLTSSGTPLTTDKTLGMEELVLSTNAEKLLAGPTSKTTIGDDVIIDGTIRTDGDIESAGAIKGDIITKGIVSLTGNHTGNIQAAQIFLNQAKVKGNLFAEGKVAIDQETEVIGDIAADNIALDGKVQGSIKASGFVVLKKNAVLSGNIQTGRISVEEGAVLLGEIHMQLPSEKRGTDKKEK